MTEGGMYREKYISVITTTIHHTVHSHVHCKRSIYKYQHNLLAIVLELIILVHTFSLFWGISNQNNDDDDDDQILEIRNQKMFYSTLSITLL